VSVVGPSLKGVVGRQAGSAAFAYSNALALAETHKVWTARNVVDFAVNPSDQYAGTSMKPVFLGPDDKRDLESYIAVRGR
jgi:cytochrome c2